MWKEEILDSYRMLEIERMTEDKDIHNTMSDKWEFNSDVTKAFDNMLERSIPDYQNMRDLCFQLGKNFVAPKDAIMDLGCSRGEALLPFFVCNGWQNKYIGLEVSEPMIEAARDRFGMITEEVVQILKWDLRQGLPKMPCGLILSVLTLQFVPINYRQKIIDEVYKNLKKDGAFIYVEKVLGETGKTDDILVTEYHNFKRRNGYTQEEVERKRLALEGVLVPITAKMNEYMLERAGFRHVECFWRNLNFAGWVCVK